VGPDGFADIRGLLSEAAEVGIFVERGELLRAAAASANAGSQPVPIGAIAIPTRARPAQLARCVQSFASRLRRHDRNLEIQVFDNSADDDSRRQLQGLDIGSRCVRYAGPDRKRAYAADLCERAGVDPATVEFALFDPEGVGRAIGANRNAALLDNAGGAFYTADDDTLAETAPVPGSLDELAIGSLPPPMENWFYDRRPAEHDPDTDVIAPHDRLLGKSVGACVRQAAGDVDLRRLDARHLSALGDGKGRVRVSATGYLGDSGTADVTVYLRAEGESLTRLLAGQPGYRRAFESRQVLSGVTRTTITRAGGFRACGFALDHSVVLPPFLPVLYGQIGLFGVTLAAVCPEDWIGFAPWVLAHAPSPRENTADQIVRQAEGVGFAELVEVALYGAPAAGAFSGARSRLHAVGTHLIELADAPPSDAWNWLHEQLLVVAGRRVLAMEASIASRPTHEAWARDVSAYAAALDDASAEPDYPVPVDLGRREDPDRARETALRLLRRFGELLVAWPALFDAAVEYRRDGHRLATALEVER
jgi:hypothetical protein